MGNGAWNMRLDLPLMEKQGFFCCLVGVGMGKRGGEGRKTLKERKGEHGVRSVMRRKKEANSKVSLL